MRRDIFRWNSLAFIVDDALRPLDAVREHAGHVFPTSDSDTKNVRVGSDSSYTA